MFATAGGRVEETVEAEKGCNHVQAKTKGGSEGGDRPLDSDCCNGKTDVLPCLGGTSRAHQRGAVSSDVDEVCCSVQERGIIVENGALALLRAPVWVLAGAPACLGQGQWVI